MVQQWRLGVVIYPVSWFVYIERPALDDSRDHQHYRWRRSSWHQPNTEGAEPEITGVPFFY